MITFCPMLSWLPAFCLCLHLFIQEYRPPCHARPRGMAACPPQPAAMPATLHTVQAAGTCTRHASRCAAPGWQPQARRWQKCCWHGPLSMAKNLTFTRQSLEKRGHEVGGIAKVVINLPVRNMQKLQRLILNGI